MGVYRTAMGKTVDMSALAAKNERVRAVGNVKNLNARGDTIDVHGKIVVPVTEKISNTYSRTVGNRSAQVTKNPVNKIQPDKPVVRAAPSEPLTAAEKEFEESFEDDLEVEQIKAKEVKAAETKTKEPRKK